MNLLNKHAPMSEKYARANNATFMSKDLSKAIMTRSRFRNKYLKKPNKPNKLNYNKQRNYCVNLIRKEKRKYYNNLDVKLITDNKQFWKTIKPFFSDKNDIHRKIALIDGDEIISDDANVAEKMNKFFSDAVSKLNITISSNIGNDNIYNSIKRFKDHPSSLKRVHIHEKFTFSMSNTADIASMLNNLNINKPTTCNNIPAQFIVDTIDMCPSFPRYIRRMKLRLQVIIVDTIDICAHHFPGT